MFGIKSKRDSTILKITEYWQSTAYLTKLFQLGSSSPRSVTTQVIKAEDRGLFIIASVCKN